MAKPTRAKAVKKEEPHSPEPSTLSGRTLSKEPPGPKRGEGSEFAGQSGDLQGLSRKAGASSESVEELVAEGQYHEAEIVGAVEGALDPDQGEVRTHEVPQDDVPKEYSDID
jgi:hypothetical protein